jgi:hypothetical protein
MIKKYLSKSKPVRYISSELSYLDSDADSFIKRQILGKDYADSDSDSFLFIV